MKKEKRDVPLRTAYSQAGRLWQPKPSSLRAQAQLMRTETCGLLNIRETAEKTTEVREQALPSAYHRQTYLLE
ncbi:hypothetical protein TNCV_4855191 [Trichonephila clavipes]|nr:hypothetical protein TNCV_4855191 [Trichonephila clavipes]